MVKGLVIRFDNSPEPGGVRFVETELDGKGIRLGGWKREGEYNLLVLPEEFAEIMRRGRRLMTSAGEKLMKSICDQLNELGVGNYAIAFTDPDENIDRLEWKGSKFWRAGIGMDFVDDVREARKAERSGEQS